MSDSAAIRFDLRWPGWRWWLVRLGAWIVRRGPRYPVVVGLYAWWLWKHGEAEHA